MKRIVIILFVFITNQIFSQSIILDPNTSFFSPTGTLRLYGGYSTDDDYNRDMHYERIGRWKVKTDTIVWGVKDIKTGTLNIELFAGISKVEDGSEVSIFLDDRLQDLTVKSTSNLQDFQSQGSVGFQVDRAGFHEIKLKIKNQHSKSNFGEIQKMVLTGSAIDTSSTVFRRRWRPEAIHGKFHSPNEANTEISVYKITVLSNDYNSYQVMTTEFGYIGSANDRRKHGLSGLNFSLWSYGADQPAPPHYQLSHLIAVGGAGNGFGRYGHEGTGVKPRGFDPFKSPIVTTFIIALRKKPGTTYNTYWCYYFDTVESKWKLYGAGKKYNSTGNLNYLNTTGGFLEVAGPPHIERSGHRMRTVEYQGWRMQHDGTWNTINELVSAYGSGSALSYKQWSVNSAGDKFVFKSGGFFNTGPNPGTLILTNPPDLPFYLQNDYLNQLYEMPADFETLTPDISGTEAVLKFKIQNLGTNPEIKVCYGTGYGLTEGIQENYIIDTVWQKEKIVPLSSIDSGILFVPLTNLKPNTEYFYRLRIKNDEGITWSFDTESFITKTTHTSMQFAQDDNQIIVYPNPANSILTLEYGQLNNKEVKIYDTNGRFIMSQIIKNNQIDVHNLQSGIYYIKLVFSGGIKMVKFVKE